eukprot:1121680-Amphidinium_carterae.1
MSQARKSKHEGGFQNTCKKTKMIRKGGLENILRERLDLCAQSAISAIQDDSKPIAGNQNSHPHPATTKLPNHATKNAAKHLQL